jgi:hypothetical protein
MDLQPRQRTVVRRLVAAALLLAATTAAPPSAQAADGAGGFSAQPAKGAPQDKSGTYFALHAPRGGVLHETLIVRNLSGNDKHFLLDAVDGLTGVTSGSVYADRDVPRAKAGTWVTTSTGTLTLKPHEVVRVPFTVRVPDVARAGDHLAGLAIQDAHRAHSKSRLSVTQIIRVVVGVKIVVDGEAHPQLALGKLAMQALPGTKVPSVVIELESTGKRLCQPQLQVSVGNDKTKTQTVTHRLDTILPGTKIPFPLPWPTALSAGTYDVTVSATHCGDPVSTEGSVRLGTTLRGTPSTPDPAPIVIVHQSSGVPVGIVAGGAAGIAVLSGALAAWWTRRRRKKSTDAQ